LILQLRPSKELIFILVAMNVPQGFEANCDYVDSSKHNTYAGVADDNAEILRGIDQFFGLLLHAN
jgi:hypothetical protein